MQAVTFQAVTFQAVMFQAVTFQAVTFQAVMFQAATFQAARFIESGQSGSSSQVPCNHVHSSSRQFHSSWSCSRPSHSRQFLQAVTFQAVMFTVVRFQAVRFQAARFHPITFTVVRFHGSGIKFQAVSFKGLNSGQSGGDNQTNTGRHFGGCLALILGCI